MTEGISSTSSVNYASMLNSVTSNNSSTDSTKKTTDEILQELKQNGMSSTMSANDIAKEYGISLSKAQEILEELRGNNEQELPEGSTVSYQV